MQVQLCSCSCSAHKDQMNHHWTRDESQWNCDGFNKELPCGRQSCVTQASAPSDSTKSCKEMKSKADKIARKGSSATEDKHLNTIIRILESKAQSKCYRKGNSHDSHATDNFFNQLWNEEKEKPPRRGMDLRFCYSWSQSFMQVIRGRSGIHF